MPLSISSPKFLLAVLHVQLRSRCQQLDASSLLPSLELHALATAKYNQINFATLCALYKQISYHKSYLNALRQFRLAYSQSKKVQELHDSVDVLLLPIEVYLLLERIAQVQVVTEPPRNRCNASSRM
jgi:hypothetical protein